MTKLSNSLAQADISTARMQDRLRAHAGHPLVGEVRGAGLIAGLELVANRATKRLFDPVGGVGLLVFAILTRMGRTLHQTAERLAREA